jgi:Fur family ferric uptake transcriptional regulator
MADSPSDPAAVAAALTARLRQAGLRATRARLQILAALDGARQSKSHDALADELGHEAMDRITVYRNLMALTRAGLVRRENGGDRIWRYRLCGREDLHKRAHPHFSCRACGDIQCLPHSAVSLTGPARSLGARPSGVEVTLSGQCDRCSALPGAPRPAPMH